MGVGLRGVRWGGASLTSYRWHYKVLMFLLWFNLFLCLLQFWRRGAPRGSTMVPLDTELVSSYRLSIQTTLISGTVWP